MSGRPKIFDDEAVINSAEQLFWSKGYELTSTEELLKAMGIGKGSFYLAFKGGKRELFEKVLDRVSRRELGTLHHNLSKMEQPLAALKSLFRNIALAPENVNCNGCLFGNTIAEFSNTDLLLKEKAINHLKQLESIFLNVIQNAQQSGELKNNADPVLLARHLLTVWNGLGITRRISPQPESLSSLIEMQLQVLV